MLVLSRRVGERVMIGPDIEVTVVAVHGDRIRLGFAAPRDVPIHRLEVHERIQSEQRDAQKAFPKRQPEATSFVI